jgi:SAM-dependent methyltransferase
MDAVGILRCPVTHLPLQLRGDGLVSTGESSEYPVVGGIAVLLPKSTSTSTNVTEYYDAFGWDADADGLSKETKVALDTRTLAYNYTKKCISRLQKYFAQGGEYILDVGSGAIPHAELMTYHARFRKRVCVDLSIKALQQAKAKLGERGEYVVGDATNLPFRDASFDAITCNHVIYQIPAELQTAAMLELWRVLKPGGVAVVVYRWPWSGIAARLEKVAEKLGMKAKEEEAAAPDGSKVVPERDPDHPQQRSWFEAQNWPFRYTYDCFRVVDNEFMRRCVSDDWRGQVLLNGLYAAQVVLPEVCGKYGTFPVLVIRKPAG